jgi:hypothetical protein
MPFAGSSQLFIAMRHPKMDLELGQPGDLSRCATEDEFIEKLTSP